MKKFTAEVLNYFGLGNERTYGSDGESSWNVLALNLAKYKVKIIQNKDVVANKVKINGCVHTSTIVIHGVSKFIEGERIVNDLCKLLSLASFSQVVPLSYSYSGEKKNLNLSAEAMYFRPLLQINNGNLIKQYLEETWGLYRINKRSRKLAEVIDMLIIAELPVQPLEIKLVQIFIVLENLKSTYAKKKKFPFFKGFYRELSNPPKNNLKKEKKMGFESLLTMMFDEVGMKFKLRRVVFLRNEIIHFGLSKRPYESLINNYVVPGI